MWLRLGMLAALPGLTVLAETAPGGSGTDLAVLIGQLGLSAVFLWQWRIERAERIAVTEKYIEFLSREGPVLAEAVDVLKTVREGMATTVDKALTVPTALDQAVSALTSATDDLHAEMATMKRSAARKRT